MDISTITQERRLAIERFGKLKRAWNVFGIQRLKPMGLAPKQSLFLRTLHRVGPCSLADIAHQTFTDPAANVRLADVLVARGWILRQEHPTDRRRWTVRLSPRGKQLALKLEHAYTGGTRDLLYPLGEKELRQFNQLLEKLLQPHLKAKEAKKINKRKTS